MYICINIYESTLLLSKWLTLVMDYFTLSDYAGSFNYSIFASSITHVLITINYFYNIAFKN